jgi:hypothetical protein
MAKVPGETNNHSASHEMSYFFVEPYGVLQCLPVPTIGPKYEQDKPNQFT